MPASWLVHSFTASARVSLSMTLVCRLAAVTLSMILSIHGCLSSPLTGVSRPTRYLQASSRTENPDSLKLVEI